MNQLQAYIPTTSTVIQSGAVAAVVVVVTLFVQRRRAETALRRVLLDNPPKDTAILHQYGKGVTVPSISPFVMKLETYLRAAKIPYINKFSRQPGPKGKLPWIQYNDQVVPDSQLCIQFLNSRHKVDLNKKLTPGQRAVGHLIRRTAEESLYWTLLMWRLVFDARADLYRTLGVPSIIIWYMRRVAIPRLWSHGIGRFSQEEVLTIMADDLGAISQILGNNRFLFGDEVGDVTEFDCALFGQLSELLWQTPGCPVGGMMTEKYPNLARFCEEMKIAFWPDWQQRLITSIGAAEPKLAPASVGSHTKDTNSQQ